LDGIDVVLVAIALFAVSETLWLAWRGEEAAADAVQATGRLSLTRDDWRRSWPAWLRGTAIGFPLGALPIGGAELPTLLSYGIERRFSKHPEEFGHGAIEGVAGPEAANNASAAGTMVPLLALGVPTTATAAVLLAAFQQFGLRPGPLLFQEQADVVWGLIASFLIGNVILVALNLPLVPLWARLTALPSSALYAGIMILATVSAYTIHHSLVDVVLLYVLAALGFGLRLLGFPIVPVVIGALLGPVAEQHLQRSLTISDGRWTIFATRPWAATILALALAIATGALLRARRRT
jgi:putative tricarboxylic transport membrane protein